MNPNIETLQQTLAQDPTNWAVRTQLAQLLSGAGQAQPAADLILQATTVPADQAHVDAAMNLLAPFPAAAEEFANAVNAAAAAQPIPTPVEPVPVETPAETPVVPVALQNPSEAPAPGAVDVPAPAVPPPAIPPPPAGIAPPPPGIAPPPGGTGVDGYYGEAEYAPEYVGMPQIAERDDTKEKLSGIGIAILANAALITLICLIPLVAPKILPPEITAVTAPAATEEVVQKEQVVQNSPPSAPSPATNVTKMISAAASSPVSVPTVDFDTPDSTPALNTGFASSMSFGSGSAAGNGIPFAMKSRCTKAERAKLLTEHGGTSKVEPAVVKSLAWLASQQQDDGSWDSTGQGAGHKGAMTGLALLSYLGHCETPDSQKYGDTVLNGIMYLVELAEKNDGVMATNMDKHYPYEHGIACYAMGETYALAKYGNKPLPGVRECFERGAEVVIDGQLNNGGWFYSYDNETNQCDTSVAGWQWQALKAAKHTGLKINRLDSAIRQAKGFYEGAQGKHGGFPYRSNGDGGEDKWTLTGAGVLALQLLGSSRNKVIEDGLKYIHTSHPGDKTWNGQGKTPRNLYAWYYNTQACFQAGGEDWEKWNGMFRDELINSQADNGSWGNSVYDTTLATLMLEVYYRYLPATGSIN